MSQETPNLNKVEKESYSEEVVRDIVKKFQEGSWKEVLMDESIGGNAGPNKAGVNAYIEKKTGRIIMFGNFQNLPKEVVSSPDYINITFIYDFGNTFQRVRNKNLVKDPEFFEKVVALGVEKQALENLKEALIRFNKEYIDAQMDKSDQ